MAFSWNRSRDWNLDAPLLQLTREGDVYTPRDSFQHLCVFGATGAGKTSAMQALSAAMLRTGYGFLVLTTKPEEIDFWITHTRENGRANDLILFDETQGFNAIDHQLYRHGAAGISNVIDCLMRILEAADLAAGSGGGRANEEFWRQSARQLLTHALPLLFCAHGRVSIASVIDFITSAATEPQGKQYDDAAFLARSFAARTIAQAVSAPAVPMPRDVLRKYVEYWCYEYTSLDNKTRSNIQVTLTAKLDRFKHGRLKACFADKTTIVPELTFLGALIVMAMPVLTWNEDGIIGQILFKYIWQRTVEARNALPAHLRARPLVCWMDEAQNYVIPPDEAFLSTARSSRTSVVAMSQSLPTYYSRLGPEKRDAADSFVGKFTTKLFLSNGCSYTNQWASSLVGRGVQYRSTYGTNGGRNWNRGMNQGQNTGRNAGNSSSSGSQYNGSGGGGSHSSGSSSGTSSGENWGANVGDGRSEGWNTSAAETMDTLIEPNVFATSLRSGGPVNGNLVDGILVRAGANFRGGPLPHAIKVTFKQRGRP